MRARGGGHRQSEREHQSPGEVIGKYHGEPFMRVLKPRNKDGSRAPVDGWHRLNFILSGRLFDVSTPDIQTSCARVPAPARSITTIHGDSFQTVSSKKPASASAKSRGVATALVHTGL
jgi:hypothetical protein